jgi:hypothetical protein
LGSPVGSNDAVSHRAALPTWWWFEDGPIQRVARYTHTHTANYPYSVRRMRWTPLSVSTTSLISPIFKANAASSKAFCICPVPKTPRSPRLRAELQSENFSASSKNFSWDPLISVWYPRRIAIASSFERVIFAWCEDRGQQRDRASKITPDLSPTRGIPAPGVFHQEMAGPNLCGPGEVLCSGKLRDLFTGEAIGGFPDRRFSFRVVKVSNSSG